MKKAPIIIVMALFLAGLAGYVIAENINSDSAKSNKVLDSEQQAYMQELQSQIEQQEKEAQIIDILNNTQVDPSFALTIGAAIENVFTSYEYEIEPYYTPEENIYLIKFKGTYIPNPDVPVTQTGSITYRVDLNTGSCRMYSESNYISSAFLLYAVS